MMSGMAVQKKSAAKKKPAAKKRASRFAVRSIKEIVAELKASRPGEKLNTLRKHDHYDSVGTWSFARKTYDTAAVPIAVCPRSL